MSVGLCRFPRRGLFIGDCIETVGACRSGTAASQGYFQQQGLTAFCFWGDIHHLLSLQVSVFGLFADARHNDTLAMNDQGLLLIMARSVRVLFTSLPDHPPLRRFGAIRAMARHCG